MRAVEFLDKIDPALLAYQDWCSVGMALKHDGATASEWEAWSRRDSARYVAGECFRKWDSFQGGGSSPVTAGTLAEFAKRQGWTPERRADTGPGHELDWDSVIGGVDVRIVKHDWLEDKEIVAPDSWNPVKDLTDYLSALFSSEEYVGFVCESWQKDGEIGKFYPKKGIYSKTCGELIQELSRCKGDLGKVIGDCNPECGAWIRFNPLDGQGVSDANVTAFRYALIECDGIPIERQAAIYAELELPAAALVHSGGKSLHAIVHIDAANMQEYRERVNYLHEVCEKNGLAIDKANKNPSRLSRLPGAVRNGQKQYLVGLNQGQQSWSDWKAFIEAANDNLPDFENLGDCYTSPPALADTLIDGVLRVGHKMLVAGPSKAGKSFMLLQLAMAIAAGRDWWGWKCRKGKVLYINLELDRASCIHRLIELYRVTGWDVGSIRNLDMWHLRGKALPLDLLAPKLIRRAKKIGYKAIIFDPIYKILTGSENEADDMAAFCNQFDLIGAETGASPIYCHHHSKGAQGSKSSRDRSSGSGVFARDPDAILDLIELSVSPVKRKVVEDRMICDAAAVWLDINLPGWKTLIGQDDALVKPKLKAAVWPSLSESQQAALAAVWCAARETAQSMSGWRVEATLREFRTFPPVNLWFRYPVHVLDAEGHLATAKADGEESPWQRDKNDKKEAQAGSNTDRLSLAWQNASNLGELDQVSLSELASAAAADPKKVKSWLKEQDLLHLNNRTQMVCAVQFAIAEAIAMTAKGIADSTIMKTLGVTKAELETWKYEASK